MKFLKVITLIAAAVLVQSTLAQQSGIPGELIRIELSSTAFPHPARENGFTYDEVFYPADDHYRDSTVLIFVPDYFTPGEKTDLVYYFHGWFNNVDTIINQFDLIDQFYYAGKNAVLVLPETAKNAPDSYAGKLEEPDWFNRLTDDVLRVLQKKDIISNTEPGRIVLSGHSGAYRVISYILLHGGLTKNIEEVILIDGLYAELEKFAYWINHYEGRFINIYTHHGYGPDEESSDFMTDMDAWGWDYLHINENELSDYSIKDYRIIFMECIHSHNGAVNKKDHFRKMLESTGLMPAGK